jgi:hypothetical protein
MAVIAFKDVSVTINSVSLSDNVRSVTLNYEIEQQDATVMGGQRSFIAGVQNNSLEVTLLQDFAASDVEATIFPLVGTQTTVVVKPTSSATSSTNPAYTLTNTYLSGHTPINAGDVGAIGEVTLTFTGGTLTKATS